MNTRYLYLMRTLLLCLLFIIPAAGRAAISITIGSPAPSAKSSDQLNIEVAVSSTYELDTIWAVVEDRSTPLLYDQTKGAYVGSLSLTGLPQGMLQLKVSVQDVFGNSQTATRDFIFDSYPVVTIISPVENAAYQNKLHIKVNVSDVGSANCKGKITNTLTGFKVEFVNSIDTMLDVIPNIDASNFQIVFSAIDSANQIKTVYVLVFKDNSSYLSHYFTGIGKIIDFKDNRVLMTTTDSSGLAHYSIVSTLDSSSEAIDLGPTQNADTRIFGAILCQGGAAFIIGNKVGAITQYHAYLWRNGALLNISQPLGTAALIDDLQSAGNYLMWLNGMDNISITDLTTLNTSFTGANVLNIGNYLSPEGDIAYSVSNTSSGYNVVRYSISNQTTTPITNNSYSNIYPTVDNNNLIYLRRMDIHAPEKDSLHLVVGTVDYNLGHPEFSNKRATYTLYDGHALYKKDGQVWLWSPGNTVKQLSFFSTVSEVDKLGADGKALFTHLSGRYYADSVTAFTRVAGISGNSFYVNNEFYLALGGTLYKYNMPSGALQPHIISITPDSAIAGATITIKGTNFIHVNGVSLGGVAVDSFSVTGDSVITAAVGAGASGNVMVTTPGGTDTLAGFTFLYSLPENNFKLSNTNASCIGADNGAILITAVQNNAYTATITGNGIDTAYHFTTSIRIKDLAAGTYQVCLTVAGQPTYQQCFTAVIGQPKDLSVYMAVNETAREVTLSMSGADRYYVALNDATITTSNSQLTLDLKNGVNEIMVTTDKACQGAVTKRVSLDANNMAYPNPFHNTIRLDLGAGTVKKGIVTIYNLEGKAVYAREFANQSGAISLNVSMLQAAPYVLKLTADNEVSVFKIMKR